MKSLRRIFILTTVLALMVCMLVGLGVSANAAAPASIEINGIVVSSGRYLKEGASSTTTSKPSDHYAYYNNGVLTLKNFDVTSTGYTVLAQGDLTITLNGTNTLSSNESNTICVTGNLTIKGDGKLTISTKQDDTAAIYVHRDMTVSSGTLSVSNIDAAIDAGNRLFITGGSVTATNTGSQRAAVRTTNGFSMTGGSLTVTALEMGGIYSTAGNVVIDGGKINVTATESIGIQSQKAVAISGGDITVMSNIGISAQEDVSIEEDTKLLVSSKSNALYTPKKVTVTGLENTLLFYSTGSRPIAASSVSIGDGIAASMSDNRDGSSPKAFDVSKTSTRYVYIRPAAVTVSGIGMYPGDYLKQGDTAASTYKVSSGSYAALTGGSGSYQLELNNFTVQSGNYGIQSTDALRLKLNGTNKLTSSNTGVRVESGDLTVSGSGSLQVTSSQNYTSGSGFDVRNGDYLHEGGTVTITSARYGVKAKNDIIVKSGALTANSELGWGAYSKNLYVTGGSARLLGAMSAVYYTGEFDYGSYQVSGYRSESGPLESYAASKHDDYLMLNIARHSCYAAGVAKWPATCTATGKEAYYTCLGCGKNYEDSLCTKEITNISTWGVIPAKGHTPIDGWESNGTHHWKTCKKCNVSEIPGTKVSHSGGTATCLVKAQCSACKTSYGNLGEHKWSSTWDYTTASGHAHACTVSGCTAISTVEAHKPGPAATEQSAQTCTDCNFVIAPKLNHTHKTSQVKAVAASCTAAGNKAYYVCDGCSKWFNDSAATQEITDKNSVVIAALGHSYAAATCTAPKTCMRAGCGATEGTAKGHSPIDGWVSNGTHHWKTCKNCTVSEIPGTKVSHSGGTATCVTQAQCSACKTSYGSLASHKWSSTWDYTAASGHAHACTVSGCTAISTVEAHKPGPAATEESAQTCTDCNFVIAPKLNHVHATSEVKAKSASCTATGNTAYFVCDGCSKWFSDAAATREITDKNSVVVAALGHDYAAATCTAPKTCNRCNATEGTAVGHKFAAQWTMDKDGHWKVCTVCGTADEKQAHDPGPAATETTDQVCTVCSYVIVKAVSHTHNYSDQLFSDATNHWQACGCGEKTAVEAHADANGDGMCDKCAYVLPVAPTDPTTPVAPTDPTNPVAPTEPAPTQPSGNEAAGADLTWLWIVIAVVVGAGAAIAVILLSKKKK